MKMEAKIQEKGFACLSKLKGKKEIAAIIKKLKKKGKKIVSLNGSFDLLHAGHIYMIEQAKKQGDVLVVGLNSEKSYKAYKDKRGPIFSDIERAIMLCSIEQVDYVVLFDEPVPFSFIEAVMPDIHCNGAEYGKGCVEAELLKKNGIRLKLIDELKISKEDIKLSTSAIIDKIIARFGNKKRKAIFLDRDGVLNVDYGYVYEKEKLELVAGMAECLKKLKALGYAFIIITNQSGIALGKFSIGQMHSFNERLVSEYKKHGISFLDIYYCPHHPSVEKCDCRKPGFVMWQKAKKEHNIDLAKSWTIGDKLNDCIAGKRAGTKTILLKSAYVSEQDSKSEYVDFFVANPEEIYEIITS